MKYLEFSREQWVRFRKDTPLTLTEDDLAQLKGVNESVSMQEVEDIYLPLSRLLNLYVTAGQALHSASGEFLGTPEPKVPYIIGVAGSVAVGKSTTSRILQELLSRWSGHPDVVIVTTDGFLYPKAVLEERNMMGRKGFPESYDVQALLQFLENIKSGVFPVEAPVYSHHHYDVVPNEKIVIDRPDIVIVEGLNILQTGVTRPGQQPKQFVSDYFDFTIYVDADTDVIRQWFIDRVWTFCQGSFQQPDSYFHFLSKLNYEEAVKFGERVWREINELNLYENILPFRERARLILHKNAKHEVERVLLRKL